MFERVESILAEVRLNDMAAASIVLRETGEWVGLVRYFPTLIENGPTHADAAGSGSTRSSGMRGSVSKSARS